MRASSVLRRNGQWFAACVAIWRLSAFSYLQRRLEHRARGAPQTRSIAILCVAPRRELDWTQKDLLKSPSWRSGIGLVNRDRLEASAQVVYTHLHSPERRTKRRMSAVTQKLAAGQRRPVVSKPTLSTGPYNKPRSETVYPRPHTLREFRTQSYILIARQVAPRKPCTALYTTKRLQLQAGQHIIIPNDHKLLDFYAQHS